MRKSEIGGSHSDVAEESGLLGCKWHVNGQAVPSIFWVKQSNKLWNSLALKTEGITILRYAKKYSPERASHARRPESSK
jgi:hypothetical protein